MAGRKNDEVIIHSGKLEKLSHEHLVMYQELRISCSLELNNGNLNLFRFKFKMEKNYGVAVFS